MDEVNLGMCHEEVFTFISKCKNTKQLLLYDITDDSEDASDIVKGVTPALPKLDKLRILYIWDVYLQECGKSLLDNVYSRDLRVLSLTRTHLGGNRAALTSCLSRLPLLSYFCLYNSGLSKLELIQVLQVLPSSCPNLVYLETVSPSFSNVEFKPVFSLNLLCGLGFSASSSEDLIEALKNVPKTLELLYLSGDVSVLHKLHEFLSAIRSLPRLRFLAVNKGCLDFEGEQNVSDLLNQTGGRFVNSGTDSQGWMDYEGQVTILRNECFNAT